MHKAFDWNPQTRLLARDDDADIVRLRDLVRAGMSFDVSLPWINALPAENPETADRYLHCRTSGSSGQPKSIRRTQASWVHSFEVNAQAIGIGPRDCLATFGTLDYSLTLYAMLEAAYLGADILPLGGQRPDAQLAHCARANASVLYVTPAQLGLLCGARTHTNLPSVRHIIVGGGRLMEPQIAQTPKVFPKAQLTQFYGAAETSFIALSDDHTPPGSVGQAYPGVILSIRDSAGFETSEVGEIWVQSPYLFDSYAVGHSPDTRWQDGFLALGEYGQLDAQGNLFVMGRKSRMVTVADHNVFPEEVEATLSTLVQADHVAVIPRVDPKRGHHLIAVVAGAVGAPTEDTILKHCRQQLGPLKSPRQVYFVDDMPLLPAGKPDYRALTTWLEAQT